MDLLSTASPRKRHLLACACVRSIWCLVCPEARRAVIEAENGIVQPVANLPDPEELVFDDGTRCRISAEGQELSAPFVYKEQPPAVEWDDAPYGPPLPELMTEILTPCAIDPTWRTDTVLALAARIEAVRDFAAMPILGDALEEAGCQDAVVLDHCRSDAVHFLGCFVLDAVLHATGSQ